MNEAEIQLKSVMESGMHLDKKGIITNHDIEIKGIMAARLICLKTVLVDENAVVNGDIYANEVIVKGIINGNIYAKTIVKLCQNCKVCGKIFYGDLEVEKTAVLVGTSEKKSIKKLDRFFKSIKAHQAPAKAAAKVAPVKAAPAKEAAPEEAK